MLGGFEGNISKLGLSYLKGQEALRKNDHIHSHAAIFAIDRSSFSRIVAVTFGR